jgi:hypothetical protein
MFCHAATHISLIHKQCIDILFADGLGPVAQDHACRVFYTLYGEAEGRESFEFAEPLIKFLQCSEWIILLTDQVTPNPGGPYTRLCVGDSEDYNLMAPLFQATRERGHWVNMPRTGETERSQLCHVGSRRFVSRACGKNGR